MGGGGPSLSRIEEGESATVRVVSTTGSAFAEERVATLRFGGNATEGSDYTVGSRSLTIAAGARREREGDADEHRR